MPGPGGPPPPGPGGPSKYRPVYHGVSGGSTAGLCGGSGCTIGLSGWGAFQADLAAGVLVAF